MSWNTCNTIRSSYNMVKCNTILHTVLQVKTYNTDHTLNSQKTLSLLSHEGELWSIYCEYFGENHYKTRAICMIHYLLHRWRCHSYPEATWADGRDHFTGRVTAQDETARGTVFFHGASKCMLSILREVVNFSEDHHCEAKVEDNEDHVSQPGLISKQRPSFQVWRFPL